MSTERHPNPDIAALLQQHMREPLVWQPPVEFDLTRPGDQNEVLHAMKTGAIRTVFDPITDIADELYEYDHPADAGNSHKRNTYVREITVRAMLSADGFYCHGQKS